jgi:hypothetical protein
MPRGVVRLPAFLDDPVNYLLVCESLTEADCREGN